MEPNAVHILPQTLASLSIFLTASFLLACTPATPDMSASSAPKKVIESNVFRSVLDGKPRMLTLDLGNQVKVAYDTQSASLYKVWQGDINLSGAVFDSRHGPQPSSQGQLFYIDKVPYQNSLDASLAYAGYQINTDNGKATLLYKAHADEAQNNHSQASIQESVDYSLNEQGIILTRTFTVSGLTAQSKPLTIVSPWLSVDSKVSGDGSIELSGETASLILYNGSTQVTTQHTAITQNKGPAKETNIHPGLVQINNSDCAACHNPQVKTVGPSYQAIAERYINTEGAKQSLAGKIISGGKGNWGQVPMTAHPELSTEDAVSMVEYIFTLADVESTESSESGGLMLNQAAVDIAFASGKIEHTEDQEGAYVYLARLPINQEPNLASILESTPEMGGLAKQIHLPNADAFAVVREMLSLRIHTNLYLNEPLKTTLRLVSDDGSYLYLNGEQIIDNWGFHGDVAVDAEVDLAAGMHPMEIVYMQGLGGASLSLQWLNPETGKFEVIPASMLRVTADNVSNVVLVDPSAKRAIPGDQQEVAGVHPAFDLFQARPDDFKPMVGGIDFLNENTLVVSTWDPEGSLYLVEDYTLPPEQIKVTRIAKGLAEPLGVKVVDGDIYVLQKQELTRLVDTNNDKIIDRYESVANGWTATANFHEFAFGLEYEDGYFYAALAIAIEPGGASTQPQAKDRGKAIKISKEDGSIQVIAQGLRTPNGIGRGIDGGLFIADNQGDWLPSSKIVELTQNAFYGSRAVDMKGTVGLKETKPVVWLPQNEIGNSPSQPAPLNLGPYQNQMIHGEVTHGGLKRVFAERVDGRLQGAVFRFSQGLEAGVNRIAWASDGSLIVGGVGNPGNWGHSGRAWYGLQRLKYNGASVFEMLSVSARSDGFEITFTEPVKAGQNISQDDFEIKQWRYEPTAAYGGDKLDEKTLVVTEFTLSEDRTKAQFKLDGMETDRVLHFRIKSPFVSENNNELWTTEAWYTLNAIPKDLPLEINPDYQLSHNQLTLSEQKDGWQLLFDGKSLDGLRNYNKQSLGKRWGIDDGALYFSGKSENDEGWNASEGGDVVITKEPLENYELYLEWKLQRNGNSGIIYNVKEREDLQYSFLSGLEMQILDNLGHSDGQIVTHRAGDSYDLIESRFVTVNPPGEWNRIRLVVNNNKIEHWQNGYKVIDTEMFTPEWDTLIAKSKFAEWPDFAKSPGGHIVLQDHGDKVWFRNIKIRDLSE